MKNVISPGEGVSLSHLINLRQALCVLLSLTDHRASRELACLGICLIDIQTGVTA